MAQKEHSYQELWIDLCISLKKSERNDLPDRFDTILEILNNLTGSDLISGFNTVKTPTSVRVSKTKRLTSANKEKGRENEFNTYQRWANRNDLSLEPFFIRKSQSTYEEIQFPEIYLVVKDAPDRLYTAPAAPYPDRDGLATVRGVFPCADSKRKYEITDYLNAVKNGENWKNRSINQSLSTPDHGAHGSIKSDVYQNSDRILGEEWLLLQDEYPVGEISSDDVGRIDLAFEHQSNERYLLVEVKPEKEKVDKAIGQIYRYKYKFLEDSNLPHLTPDDISLVIVAPEFHNTHIKAASELGVDLIEAS
jgi:hypothetical protein